MEIIIEQIKQTITKEITGEILKECIEKIKKVIEQEQAEVSKFYVNGLIRAINIIEEKNKINHNEKTNQLSR